MQYTDYFKDHYKARFCQDDIENYGKWFQAQLNFIQRKHPVDFGRPILEIGSGIGGFYNLVKPPTYIGLELDSAAAKFATEHFHQDCFLNVSLEGLDTNQKFDYAFAFEVLEHLEDPVRGILKISKLLSERGVFIGTSPYPFRKNIFADKTHLFVLHPENWRRLFLMNGFQRVDVLPMSFIPCLWRVSRKLNLRMPFYIPFKHFISTTLIIAQK